MFSARSAPHDHARMCVASGRPVTASPETDRSTWKTVYVSNVFAASADWRTGAAVASWAFTFAAWTSGERASGGTPSAATGGAVTTGRAVAIGAAEATGAGWTSAAARAAATWVAISASREMPLASNAAPPAAPPIARPTTRPIVTKTDALLSWTPRTRCVLQPGQCFAPIASGRWQLGHEKTV